MKIGIITGSIRDERRGDDVGRFVADIASKRSGTATYELIDLKRFDVPLLTSPTHPMQAERDYEDQRVRAWGEAIDACDAFVFVTPEYNHGVPGAMKNAVDSLGPEWMNKVVGFVGYGSASGVRAIEQWRQIVCNFAMPTVRAEVNLSIFTDWTDGEFTPADRRADAVSGLLDAVEELAAKLA